MRTEASAPHTPATGERRLPAVLVVCLAAPLVAVTFAVLAFAFSESLGYTPFSLGPPRNIAEAAGMGSGAEVLRLLRSGGDPNAIMAVRPEIISSVVTRVTALEAAVWSRRQELVRLLDLEGAIVGAESRRHLACLARDLGAGDIVEYLSPADPGCVPQQAFDLIVRRSEAP